MTNSIPRGTLSRGDRAGLIVFCIAGVAIAVNFVVYSIFRIVELARGTDVPVIVEFSGEPVEVPLGTGGGTVPVGLDQGTITAAVLPPIATVPGIIGQVIQVVTILVVIGCLILLSRSIFGGKVFNRRNTGLVMTAGITGLVGFAAVRFFENMLANATVAVVTDNAVENLSMTVEPVTYILAAFVASVIGTAFVIGDKLQRETEGLV